MQRGKHIEDCTKLFDPDIFENPEKGCFKMPRLQIFLKALTTSNASFLFNGSASIFLDPLKFNLINYILLYN